MVQKMQLRNGLKRRIAEAFDRFPSRPKVSRAAVCRLAEVDPSTIWRANKTGNARLRTLSDYGKALLGMNVRSGRSPDLVAPIGADLISRISEWIADRREPVEVPEADLAALTVLAAQPEFRRAYGSVGLTFCDLANLKAAGMLTGPYELVLGSVALALMDKVQG